ncbi:MAG: peptide deformylase [Actinobacteria bacterium]|nr:peptide deformylase [Actinomycetota bacterium]
MAIRRIRTYGDPVLTQPALPVRKVDTALRRLAEDMIETMYDAPGVGLAGPQVGVQLRIFVYDAGDGPNTVINPVLSAHSGEWTYDEGCLSVPGYYWPIVRPLTVHLEGEDLDGNKLSVDADEYVARIFQHETDHLDGTLLLKRLTDARRKRALRDIRVHGFNPPEVHES